MSTFSKAIELLELTVDDYHSGEDQNVTYRRINDIESFLHWYHNKYNLQSGK